MAGCLCHVTVPCPGRASLLLTSIPVGCSAPPTPGRIVAAEPSLPHAAHGQQAIRLLGDQLDEAAALNGLTPAKLREVLSSDPTAWVDPTARVYYVEPVATSAGGSVEPPQEVAPFPLDQTFLLHSRPASTHKLFLDFDGTTVSGTAWNDAPFNLPDGFYSGYSLDGDPDDLHRPGEGGGPEGLAAGGRGLRRLRRRRHHPGPGRRRASTAPTLADQIFGTRAMITGNGTARARSAATAAAASPTSASSTRSPPTQLLPAGLGLPAACWATTPRTSPRRPATRSATTSGSTTTGPSTLGYYTRPRHVGADHGRRLQPAGRAVEQGRVRRREQHRRGRPRHHRQRRRAGHRRRGRWDARAPPAATLRARS